MQSERDTAEHFRSMWKSQAVEVVFTGPVNAGLSHAASRSSKFMNLVTWCIQRVGSTMCLADMKTRQHGLAVKHCSHV